VLPVMENNSMRVVILHIVISILGTIPLCLQKHLKTLNIYYNGLIPKMQNTILNSCHIVQRFVTEYHQSSETMVYIQIPMYPSYYAYDVMFK